MPQTVVHRLFLLFLLSLACSLAWAGAPSQAQGWDKVPGPAVGTTASIGVPTAGCLAGAGHLAADGPGWQVMRLGRNRAWGHPDLVAYIQTLAARGALEGLPPLLVGDMSQPRGGPMPSGHRSHQTGLDVDLMFEAAPENGFDAAQREAFQPRTTLKAGGEVDPGRFGHQQEQWLRLAAESPGVDRIFVNYRLKKLLCGAPAASRAWLHKIRPWNGHDEHFHVRLACPGASGKCLASGATIPDGDGCGRELDSWFEPPGKPPAKPPTPIRPSLPRACASILAAP